jgi:hypothetical protein
MTAPSEPFSATVTHIDHTQLFEAATTMLRTHDALRSALPGGIVHDPAVSILLNLFIRPDGMTDDALSAACGVPLLSFGRWTRALANDGLITSGNGGQQLSEAGRTSVEQALRVASVDGVSLL